jgi:hypothetical protein
VSFSYEFSGYCYMTFFFHLFEIIRSIHSKPAKIVAELYHRLLGPAENTQI